MSGLSLHPEGLRVINLLQERNMLPSTPLKPPVPNLHEDIQKLNCNPELFRCTLTSIPQTQALLNKAKLPLGLLLHPFKDLVLRPPQPPVYLFVFDVSHNAVETGYLNSVCQSLLDNLDLLPGNTRTKIGFITFDSTIHFYSLQEGLSQPQMLIVSDIEDVFIPMPENLLVNLNESKEDIHLTPSTDFYKKLALDCSGQQVAVDLFLLSGQYSDLASLGCISRYSAGSVYYYPSYHHQHNPVQVQKLHKELQRYLTRKIGFEAVMRIRCTKGLSIHTFHGNFFVRSTDLLSLPNVNPDAGYAVQMSVEESLTDTQLVSFQSALLYTSSKGERRIRVHTLCLPVVSTLNEVFLGADVQAISGLLANMAVDRSVTASLSDARDALVNAVIDSLSAYRSSVLSNQQPGLMVPFSLRLFPLFVLALLKQKSFQTGTNARLDERIFAMCQVKNQPLVYLMLTTHPSLYRVDNLSDEGAININDRTIPQPPILQLSVEKLSRDGAFLMDAGSWLKVSQQLTVQLHLKIIFFLSPGTNALGWKKLWTEFSQPSSRSSKLCINSTDYEEESQTKSKQQDSDKLNSLTIPSVSKRVVLGDSISAGATDQQSGVPEVKGTQLGDKLDSFIKPSECGNDISLELRQRNRGDLTADTAQRGSRHGLEQYLSRFEEAMKLRKQLISEKPNQEDGNTTEEFDSFRIFRLVGCALLAFGVRAFVCKYLERPSQGQQGRSTALYRKNELALPRLCRENPADAASFGAAGGVRPPVSWRFRGCAGKTRPMPHLSARPALCGLQSIEGAVDRQQLPARFFLPLVAGASTSCFRWPRSDGRCYCGCCRFLVLLLARRSESSVVS
ncbi:hypothetical protein CB1_000434027 [Camelus ferus]|nr:hypothetical protein CB1_000434027 [Camelus ferus]